jgi:hypothetical protein
VSDDTFSPHFGWRLQAYNNNINNWINQLNTVGRQMEIATSGGQLGTARYGTIDTSLASYSGLIDFANYTQQDGGTALALLFDSTVPVHYIYNRFFSLGLTIRVGHVDAFAGDTLHAGLNIVYIDDNKVTHIL